jgi:hypothetical protein
MFLVALSFLRNKNIERKDIVKTFVSINLYTLTLITVLSADKLFFLL